MISFHHWITDPALLGSFFAGQSWAVHRVMAKVIDSEPLDADEHALFTLLTGRKLTPKQLARVLWFLFGRRAGKTIFASALVVATAAGRNWRAILAPGELAVCMLLACDRRQAAIALRYIKGMLRAVPMLAALIESETTESVTLSTGARIEVHTSSFSSVRGYSAAIIVLDEFCFIQTDGGSTPQELVRALKPALASIPGARLVVLSTPYRIDSLMHDEEVKHWGNDESDVLFFKGPTRLLNPTIDEAIVNEALAEDEAGARAEWLGEWRSDVASFLDRVTLMAAVVPERGELPYSPDHSYVAFTDPAGGAGRDSMTSAVAHKEKDGRCVVDSVLEIRPPFDPGAATREVVAQLQRFRLTRVVGDRFGGTWPAAKFQECGGVAYEESELVRSQIYLETLPLFAGKRVELPDNERLVKQLLALERVTGRGRDIVDHPKRGGVRHDDLANVACGALQLAAARRPRPGPIKLIGW